MYSGEPRLMSIFARDDIVRGFSAACWLSTHNFDGRPSFQQMLGAGSAAALEALVTTNQIPRSARNDSLKAFTGHEAAGRRVAQFNRLRRAYLALNEDQPLKVFRLA